MVSGPYDDTAGHDDVDTIDAKGESSTLSNSSLWHGMGLFGESYLLFSVGTLRPFWTALYPHCFDGTECAPWKFQSLTYSVVIGVMTGMIILGFLANDLGRRKGSIITASFMCAGSMILTLSSFILSSFPSTLFPVMSASLFLFGIGVGGEYPLSASSASERAMLAMQKRILREKEQQSNMKHLLTCPNGKKNKPDKALASNETATTTPWQTGLNSTNSSTMVVEESYGDIPLNRSDGSNSLSSQNVKLRQRGKEVLLVFSMQGMGIFANSLVITLLLILSKRSTRYQYDDDGNDNKQGQGNNEDYHEEYSLISLLYIWRTVYVTGATTLVYVLISRIRHLTESEVWTKDREKRQEELEERQYRAMMGGFTPPSKAGEPASPSQWEPISPIAPTLSSITMKSEFEGLGSTNMDTCRIVPTLNCKGSRPPAILLLIRHYGVRLFGTCTIWLLWDIAFYGNKLFQSSFLIALTGEDASLSEVTFASAINAFVALLGYYAAASIVDDPDVGRLTLQQSGFIITGTLFILCGCLSQRLSSTWLVIMYFGSSFFGQCGPNCTTFLIPAEIFPTEMRTLCHGVSASAGKVGALIASILFNFTDENDLFLFSGYASFAACLLTFLTIPETTTLDLFEIDKQWRMILDDRKFDYEGPAIDPKFLSFYERNRNQLCC